MPTDTTSDNLNLWDIQGPKFAAWVPCITGNLSFSLIGEGVRRCVHATAALPNGQRIVIAFQTRTALDVPLPSFLLQDGWATARYLLIGESHSADLATGSAPRPDSQGVLRGRIIILPKHRNKAQTDRIRHICRELSLVIAKFAVNDGIIELRDKVSGLIANAPIGGVGRDNAGLHLIESQFALYRSGEFRIWFEGDELGDELTSAIAKHMYYFVKDISHKHYHHSDHTDAIIPIHMADCKDDQTWRRETIYSLARACLEARRSDDFLKYKKAEGIIAYATAFQQGLGKVFRDPNEYAVEIVNKDMPHYDFDHLLKSIQAKSSHHGWVSNATLQIVAIGVTVVLATISLSLASAEIMGTDNGKGLTPSPVLIWIIQFAYSKSAWLTFTLSFFGMALVFISSFRSKRFAQGLYRKYSRPFYAAATSITFRLRRVVPGHESHVAAYIMGAGLAVASFLSAYWMFTLIGLAK